jgi:hypothetical protein
MPTLTDSNAPTGGAPVSIGVTRGGCELIVVRAARPRARLTGGADHDCASDQARDATLPYSLMSNWRWISGRGRRSVPETGRTREAEGGVDALGHGRRLQACRCAPAPLRRVQLQRRDGGAEAAPPCPGQSGDVEDAAVAYKGRAEWWSVRAGDSVHQDLAWSYAMPLPESKKVAGLVSFYDEKVDVYVDGVLQKRASTRFS